MGTIHKLKTLAPYWDAIDRGEKTFEVRRDDRGFQKGDVLHLQKIDEKHHYVYEFGSHIGKEPLTKVREITYILTGGQFGIEPGFVVIGFQNP